MQPPVFNRNDIRELSAFLGLRYVLQTREQTKDKPEDNEGITEPKRIVERVPATEEAPASPANLGDVLVDVIQNLDDDEVYEGMQRANSSKWLTSFSEEDLMRELQKEDDDDNQQTRVLSEFSEEVLTREVDLAGDDDNQQTHTEDRDGRGYEMPEFASLKIGGPAVTPSVHKKLRVKIVEEICQAMKRCTL
ncbi:uncharacterized protein LOC135369721 [Ornithodoros turicata]|uniref:uncharacterized protein LOC135369721 n=1 Tax=Ornithodoros turicata TaxID=34597 RepID=UPI003139078C